MTRKFLLAALVILLAALCTVHLTTERTPPENVVSPAVHLGMVVPREALEKLKAAETAALAAPQTAEPTADVTAEPAEEESLPATDTSVLAAAVTTDALYIRRGGDWDAEALALVDYGTTVAVTGKSGGWYQVRYDGIEGYLSGEYLDLRTSGKDTADGSHGAQLLPRLPQALHRLAARLLALSGLALHRGGALRRGRLGPVKDFFSVFHVALSFSIFRTTQPVSLPV